jgi:hypothetical protein
VILDFDHVNMLADPPPPGAEKLRALILERLGP